MHQLAQIGLPGICFLFLGCLEGFGRVYFSGYGAGPSGFSSCVKWAIASQSSARVEGQSARGPAHAPLAPPPITAPLPQPLVHFEQKQRKDETSENGELYEVG